MKPKARRKGLLIEKVEGETLVYDLEKERACCLNPTATLIWQLCDGKTTLAGLRKRIERETGEPVDADVIHYGLRRLERNHLLEECGEAPAAPVSRRQLLRSAGRIGLALPVIAAVVTPALAQASCISKGQCKALVPPFCNGQPICGKKGKCCLPKKKKGKLICKDQGC